MAADKKKASDNEKKEGQKGFGDPFLVGLVAVALIYGAVAGAGFFTARETGNVPVCVASTLAQRGAVLGKGKAAKTAVSAYCRCLDDRGMTSKERRAKKSADQRAASFSLCSYRSVSCTPAKDDSGKAKPLEAKAAAYCTCLSMRDLGGKAFAKAKPEARIAGVMACGKKSGLREITYTIDTSLPVH